MDCVGSMPVQNVLHLCLALHAAPWPAIAHKALAECNKDKISLKRVLKGTFGYQVKR